MERRIKLSNTPNLAFQRFSLGRSNRELNS